MKWSYTTSGVRSVRNTVRDSRLPFPPFQRCDICLPIVYLPLTYRLYTCPLFLFIINNSLQTHGPLFNVYRENYKCRCDDFINNEYGCRKFTPLTPCLTSPLTASQCLDHYRLRSNGDSTRLRFGCRASYHVTNENGLSQFFPNGDLLCRLHPGLSINGMTLTTTKSTLLYTTRQFPPCSEVRCFLLPTFPCFWIFGTVHPFLSHPFHEYDREEW